MNDFNESDDLLATQMDLIDLSRQDIEQESLLNDSNGSNTVNNPTTESHVSIGSTMSRGGGFCVKEYEVQLETLQKENFNLKLRIYFLEKNHPNITEDAETLFSQNIDYKVQIETLTKEREEKADLIIQASKALELTEYEKNLEIGNLAQNIENLKEKIFALETDNYSLQQAISDANNKTNLGNDTGYAEFQGAVDAKAAETERKLIEMSQRVEELQHQLSDMTAMKEETVALNQKLSEQVSNLQYEKDELADQVHTVQSSSNELRQKIKLLHDMIKEKVEAQTFFQQNNIRLKHDNALLSEQIDALQNSHSSMCLPKFQELPCNLNLEKELQEYKEKWASVHCDLHDALKNYDEKEEERLKTFIVLQASLEKLRETKERVNELESQLENKSSMNKGDAKKDYDALKKEVDIFKAKIQEATTNELQEKNREIERLTELLNSLKSSNRLSIASEPPRFSYDHLYDSFNDLKFIQAMEIKKQGQLKIDQLVTELATMTTSKKQIDQIEKLKHQMAIVTEKQEFTDEALSKCSELCSYTLDHLNELTQFLSQLLQNKEIRESLSEGRLRNIQGILEKSLEFAGRQSMVNTSNVPLIDFLVNVARESISHFRDLQTSIRKNDKSIQTAAANNMCEDNKCEDDMSNMMENFEELKRVNQVLEDEIVELKNCMSIYEKKSSEYKGVINELKSENGDLDNRITELQKSIDEMQMYQDGMMEKYHNQCIELIDVKNSLIAANEDVVVKEKSLKAYMDKLKKACDGLKELEAENNTLSADLEESQSIITSLELAKLKYQGMWEKSDEKAKELEKQQVDFDTDIKKNWITKHAHEKLMRKSQEEIINAEAQVAAIRMETEKIKSDINLRKSTFTSQHECDDYKENESATGTLTRRTLEISSDRKKLLMNSIETTDSASVPCNYCEHYKKKANDLKKHLQSAVDELQKKAYEKKRTDLDIKKQINETQDFMQQIRGNLESVNQNLNQPEKK